MSDKQMQRIRELFDAAEDGGLNRRAILDLAEARVAELIDRLPQEPWSFHVADGRGRVEGVSSTETLADGLLARIPKPAANPRVEVDGE